MEYFFILEQYSWLGNSLLMYLYATGVFAVSIVVLKIFQVVVLSRLERLSKKTATPLDDVAIDIVQHIRPSLYIIVSLFISYKFLSFPADFDRWVILVLGLLFVYALVGAGSRFLDYLADAYLIKRKKGGDENTEHERAMMNILKVALMVLVWVLVALVVLSNFGINVTSLIAGLGVGGIAVALAVQNILSDIFSSFSLFIDKPFQVGDYIVVGQDSGTVKKIGFKTTRIKALRGEELVIPNKELTNARVQNFKNLNRRRESFEIGVEYGLTQAILKKIPGIVRRVITSVDDVKFGRCHFSRFGESSLLFEIVYFVESDDYEVFMNRKQQINLGIYTQFGKADISFAYPTRTVYVEKVGSL